MPAGNSFGSLSTLSVGGRERGESVYSGLEDLPEDVDYVLVHDAARPLAPSELADAVALAVRSGAAAVVPVLPVADTVKRVDASGRVVETVARADLRAVQTPPGFARDVLAAGLLSPAALGSSAWRRAW